MDFAITGSMDTVLLCRICGLLGFVSYMAGFAALQLHLIDANDLSYSLSKMIGAALVLISLSVDFNLSAALIQLSFLLIGAVGLGLRLRARRRGWSYQGDIPIPRAANQPAQPIVSHSARC